jgi:hypothetical protein
MNDEFLHALRQDPPAEFARRLKARLHAFDVPLAEERVPRRTMRWLATAASLAALSFAFTLPAVRGAAEAFLDYFRVVNFAGVAFDPQRAAQLWQNASADLPTLIGRQVEQVAPGTPPPPPVAYTTLDEAGTAAGMRLRAPAWLPPNFALAGIEVAEAHELSITGDTAKLQTILDALGINDVTIPAGLDGQVVTIRIPPVAKLLYDDGGDQITLVESRTPVVTFPTGVDLASLAEIGLRLLGLDRAEAYRFAQTIDWRSTLLVPVPANAATFHQVELQGGTGLVIETASAPRGARANGGSLVFWSSDDVVYALSGPVRATDVLQMAQSVQ